MREEGWKGGRSEEGGKRRERERERGCVGCVRGINSGTLLLLLLIHLGRAVSEPPFSDRFLLAAMELFQSTFECSFESNFRHVLVGTRWRSTQSSIAPSQPTRSSFRAISGRFWSTSLFQRRSSSQRLPWSVCRAVSELIKCSFLDDCGAVA